MNLQRYEARLRLLPCVVCVLTGKADPSPCEELHHIGDAQTERNDWLRVPICNFHHQGPEGIHGLRRRGFVKATSLSDLSLLATTAKLFVRDLP